MIRRPVLILLLLVLSTVPAVAAERLAGILPVVGSTEGAQGARFRTGLQLSNPSAETIRGALVFREQGKAASPADPRLEFELAPRATQSFGDVVADMGASGLGSMEILVIEGADPVVVARAYADGEGTLGVTVPLVKIDEALEAGESATLLVPSDLSRFRFNVGVRSLGEGARLKVEVFDADGSLLSTLEEKVYPADAFVQVPSSAFAGDLLANQSLRVEVVAGSAIVYGTTTDNLTNDPSLQIDRLLNKPPVLIDQDFTQNQDGSTTVELEFIDPDGDPVSVEVATAPQNGTLTSFERIGEEGWRFRALYRSAVAKTPSAAPFDQFVIIVRDGKGNVRRLIIEIPGGLNRAPTAADASYSVDQNATLEITLRGSDPDGDPLEFRIVRNPLLGTLGTLVQIDGTTARITYVPGFEASGSDSFEFEVEDTVGQTDRGTISITIRAVNDAPTARPDSYTVLEDQTLNVAAPGVLANDADVDSATLTAVLVTGPTQGTLTLSPNGSFTYIPAPNFFGTDGFSYRVSDGSQFSAPTAVTITVTSVNDPPVAADDSYNVAEGGTLNVPAPGVLGNDLDIEGGPLSAVLVSGATNGVLTLNADGSFTYTHDGSETIVDSFTYLANDGAAGSNVATVTITVTPVNEASVIDLDADDSQGTAGSGFAATFNENDAATLLQDPLDATITDPDSATLQTLTVTLTNLIDAGNELLDADVTGTVIVKSYDAATDPATGVLTLTGPATIADFVTVLRTVNYRNTSENPDETARVVTFVANDGTVDSAAAIATVSVSAVNDAPIVDAVTLSVPENAAVGTSVGSVTFTDPDAGQTHTFAITAGNTGGAFVIDPSTGAITVAAALDFEALAAYSLTVEVTDDGTPVLSGSATVGITVTDVDDAPVAVNDAATVTEDDPPTVIDVLANDTDADGGPIAIQSVTQPANGTVVITNGGADLTYGPLADYCNDGSPLDTFSYTLNGGSTGTVSVTVACVDDAPTAVADGATVGEDAAATTIDVLANDTDVDAGAISIQSVTQPANGTVVITNAGADLTYQPDPSYCNDPPGTSLETFTYTLTPGGSSTTVTMTVTCVDEAPTAVADAATVGEDSGANAIDVLANDTDPDAGPISVSSTTQPLNGAVTITGGGTGLSYTPNANYCNSPPGTTLDTFTYTLAPGGSSTTVTVTVTCVDDPATAVADAATVVEDSGANTINVQSNDIDADGGTNTIQSVTQPTNGTVVITNGGADLTYAPNLNYCNDGSPLDTFTYTLSPGGSSATVSMTVTCVNEPPVAGADAFDFIGNTELRVDLAAASTPHALETTVSGLGVLDNDSDPDGPISVSGIVGCADVAAPFVCPVAGFGTVTMEATGAFSFVPEPGDAGATEVFQYVLSDGTSSVNGTVTLTRLERVWYVKNDAVGVGNGTSTAPFNAITAANLNDNDVDGDLVDDLDEPGDYIFVYFGSGTSAGMSDGFVLENGQHLIGQHAGLSLPVNLNGNGSPTTLVAAAAGSRPLMDDTLVDAYHGVVAVNVVPGSIVGMNLAGNVNAIVWATTAPFTGTGTFTIRDNVIRSAGAAGVVMNLVGTGALNLAFHDNTITSTGNAVDIREDGTGALTITAFDDNVVNGNTGGDGIVVTNAVFDSVPGGGLNTVNGGTTLIGASGNGVGGAGLLLSSVQGDLHFTGNLNIFADGGTGLLVSGTGLGMQFRVNSGGASTGIIEATGGPAVLASSVAFDLRPTILKSTNSSSTGVSLTGVTGTFLAETGSSITNATGTDFLISGGTASVTYRGTITDDVGQLVSVSGATAGTKSFEGAITDGNDGDGSGISLVGNTGATINFTGGLALSTGANDAFTATGGGTVNVTGTNTAATTTGIAVNVANTTIGASDLTFRSISSNGGANSGIVLTNTGTLGGLTVAGTGSAGSGGTIQNKTVNGIALTNTRDVNLSWMSVTNNDGSGIFGDDVTNFTLSNSSITNNGDTATGVEANLRFHELLGTCSISGSTISGSFEDEIRITPASGVLNNLAISGSTIGPNSITTGGHGIAWIGTNTAQGTISVTGTTFQTIRSTGVLVNGTDTTVMGLNVSNSIFRDAGAAVTMQTSASSDLTFSILNNTEIVRSISNAIQLVAGSTSLPASTIRGTISGNAIGNGTADSGSRDLYGIAIDLRGDQDAVIAINSNTVRNTDFDGIWVSSADFGVVAGPSAIFDVTVRDNTVFAPDDNSLFPSGFVYGTLVDVRHTTNACMDMAGNTSAGVGGAEHFRVRQRDTAVFRIERLTDGDATPNELINSAALVETHIVAQNDPGSTADAVLVSGFTEAGNGACRKP